MGLWGGDPEIQKKANRGLKKLIGPTMDDDDTFKAWSESAPTMATDDEEGHGVGFHIMHAAKIGYNLKDAESKALARIFNEETLNFGIWRDAFKNAAKGYSQEVDVAMHEGEELNRAYRLKIQGLEAEMAVLREEILTLEDAIEEERSAALSAVQIAVAAQVEANSQCQLTQQDLDEARVQHAQTAEEMDLATTQLEEAALLAHEASMKTKEELMSENMLLEAALDKSEKVRKDLTCACEALELELNDAHETHIADVEALTLAQMAREKAVDEGFNKKTVDLNEKIEMALSRGDIYEGQLDEIKIKHTNEVSILEEELARVQGELEEEKEAHTEDIEIMTAAQLDVEKAKKEAMVERDALNFELSELRLLHDKEKTKLADMLQQLDDVSALAQLDAERKTERMANDKNLMERELTMEKEEIEVDMKAEMHALREKLTQEKEAVAFELSMVSIPYPHTLEVSIQGCTHSEGSFLESQGLDYTVRHQYRN